MFLGLMNLFIFSVSTTLKSYVIIMTRTFFKVNNMFLYLFLYPENALIV